VESIESSLQQAANGDLAISFVLKGNIEALRLPARVTPERADGLWRHTCFEAFVAVTGTSNYYEFNFSPSGQWGAYAFRAYRDGAALEDAALDPEITPLIAPEQFELRAIIRLVQLPAISSDAALRAGLAAVIEERDGRLSYWALNHPQGKPDFHDPDGFIIAIQRPVDAAGNTAYNSKL
jgi:hypothetical protein